MTAALIRGPRVSDGIHQRHSKGARGLLSARSTTSANYHLSMHLHTCTLNPRFTLIQYHLVSASSTFCSGLSSHCHQKAAKGIKMAVWWVWFAALSLCLKLGGLSLFPQGKESSVRGESIFLLSLLPDMPSKLSVVNSAQHQSNYLTSAHNAHVM